jgi:hypothetical protein
MESAVAQVSRYLDRDSVVLFSQGMEGLLMCAFQRSLYRHAAKLRRVETLGGTADLSTRAVDLTWPRHVHARLELDQIIRLLSERSRTILALRYAALYLERVRTNAWRICFRLAQCFLDRRSPSKR